MIVRTIRLVVFLLVFCATTVTLAIAQQANKPLNNAPETRLRRLIAIVESNDSPDRHLAILRLAEMKAKAAPAVPVLCTALSDRQHATRASAVDAIVAIGVASAKPLRELLDSPLNRCRAAAASALDRLDQLQPKEIRQLAKDGDPRVRVIAASALTRSGAPGVAQLVAMLSDSEPAVAVEAARGLQGNQEDPSIAVPGLIKSLPREHVGWAAAIALGSYGVKAKRAIPWLVKAHRIGRPQRFMPEDAAEVALYHIGPPHEDDIPLLCECLQRNDIEAQILAANCFVRSGADTKEAIKALETAIDAAIADYSMMKQEAESAPEDSNFMWNGRGMIVAERCAVAVWNGTHDPVRFLALAQRIAERSGSAVWYDRPSPWDELPADAYPSIKKLLSHREEAVRLTALQGIAEFGPKALPFKESLLVLTEDPDGEIATLAILTLASIGPAARDEAAPRVLATYQAGKIILKEFASAVEQLTLQSVEAREILEKGLQAPETWNSIACAKALVVAADDPRWAAARVIKASEDDHITGGVAVEILQDLESVDDLLLPFLTQQLGSEDYWARRHAVNALANMGERAQPAIVGIGRLLTDEHLEIRLGAAKAMFLINGDATFLDEQLKEIFGEREGTSGRLLVGRDQHTAVETIAELGQAGARYLKYITALANSGELYRVESAFDAFDALEGIESYHVEHAIDALEAIGTPAAVAALRETAESPDWVIRSSATEALQRLHGTGIGGVER